MKAKWFELTYTISYDLEGGVCENLKEEFSANRMIKLPNPTKEGYTFIGWYDDNNNLVSELEYKNYKLKAKWEETIYKIVYDLDGGSCKDLLEEFTITNMISLQSPIKDGYAFIGWYDEKDNLVNTLELKNYNLKAKWEEIVYTINYELDDGECNNLPEEFSASNMIDLPIPTKKGYTFVGWYDENNIFVNFLKFKNYNLKAKWFVGDGINIYIGKYPQTKITENELISELEIINDTNELGYIEYNGNEYQKYYNRILKNNDYFLIEPIKWKILEKNNNTCKIISELILDYSVFYEDYLYNRTINNNTVYPNSYEFSNIRAWLNGYDGSSYDVYNYTGKGFIDRAFTEEERKSINETNIDNSASTTESQKNEYSCNNTLDKIYLLSYQEGYNYFTSKAERKAKVTDYAKVRGVNKFSDGYAHFWLRSPSCKYNYAANLVFFNGEINSQTLIGSFNAGVRPVIEITIK